MSKTVKRYASESVAAGHPDKIADQISDAILDAVLRKDPAGRTAVETLVAHQSITLAGELHTTARLDIEQIVRAEIARLGYTNPDWGFSDKSPITNHLHQQSPEIAIGVEQDGAGDQGLMFGYATNETPEYLPLPIALVHKLTRGLDMLRETGKLTWLRPDGKAQVVIRYEDEKPIAVEHVTIAAAHDESVDHERVKRELIQFLIVPTLAGYNFSVNEQQIIVNGTGVWHIPGPSSDAGLTGRKIVVDTYGGLARVGGGAFSGKDPSKVDRSGAYAARYIAKNIVAAGLADRAEVSLAYYIGGQQPVQFGIETFGTEKISREDIQKFSDGLLDLSVKSILGTLNLRQPIYAQTAVYGHFGKPGLPWEQIV